MGVSGGGFVVGLLLLLLVVLLLLLCFFVFFFFFQAEAGIRVFCLSRGLGEVYKSQIMMHGGPATVYGARAFSAFREFNPADDQ